MANSALYDMGEFGRVNVPKKAIAAQDIIYQLSTHLSTLGKCGIPMEQAVNEMIKTDVTAGTTGHDKVRIDAPVDPSKLEYKTLKSEIEWSNYTYTILEGAKLGARVPNAMWRDSIRSAAEYFAAVKDYRFFSALSNVVSTTSPDHSVAATAVWDGASADIETDIVNAIQAIAGDSNIQSGEKITVVVPTKVEYQAQKLTLINNIQRTIKDYLQQSFGLQIIGYRPPKDETGTVVSALDGLGNHAYVFAQGANTGTFFEYSRAEAARRGIVMVEHSRLHARGDMYTQKMGTACLMSWDRIGTYTSSTSYKNTRVYKIEDVKT